MLIVVDPHSGVPVYRQLMDQIKFHVASGLLRAGEELPSTRALSLELGVNPMTISKAYSYLEREQVVERRPGRPLVVRALPADEIQAQRLDRLRESLSGIVTMMRQLGISADEGIGIFRDLLDEAAQGADGTGEPGGNEGAEAARGSAGTTGSGDAGGSAAIEDEDETGEPRGSEE
jgi:DNA-binding transcriptional regulator YhcF (GntR family)